MAGDKAYVKRVVRSVIEMAQGELGVVLEYPRARALVLRHLPNATRPSKREEFAAWVFEREKSAIAGVAS